ncbi:MAG: hypothetical protein Kow0025_20600 [Thermodesulfovibrionales bacterium]
MRDRISETARVIEARGGEAVVRLLGGQSCRKCGLAAIGLCKPGGTGMELRVENRLGASPGDVVKLGLDAGAKRRGYFFAYTLPLVCFTAGAMAGHLAGQAAGLGGQWLTTLAAFLALLGGLPFSINKLRGLDSSERMYVSSIVKDVPDFHLQAGDSPEGAHYLEAYLAPGRSTPHHLP